MNEVEAVIKSILMAIYKGFFSSLVMAILFMFVYTEVKRIGIKQVIKKWIEEFSNNKEYRRTFFFAFYSAMILFNTLLGRSYWSSVLDNVLGKWQLYTSDGVNVDGIINIIFFIPFIFMLFVIYERRILKKEVTSFIYVSVKAIIISFCVSLGIEFSQMIFKLGTVQLADIAYNTLGGFLGGTIYFWFYKIKNRHKNNHTSDD